MFLGIDIGTTNISFLVIDLNCKVIYQDTYSNTFILGNNMQDPDGIHILCNTVAMDLKKKFNFSSVGISNQMHGILYVDECGNAVSPLYTWQDDRGNEKYRDSTYASYMSNVCGYNLSTGFGTVSLFYDFVNDKIPMSSKKICTIGDYVAMKLTNLKKPILNETNAAALGLYKLDKHTWDYEVIRKLGLDESLFPDVSNKVICIGRNDLGFNVYTAVGDNQASVYGVADTDECVVVNYGTGSQITFIVEKLTEIPFGCEVRPYFDGKCIIIGSALCGGYSYQILKKFFDKVAEAVGGKFSYEILNQWATSDEPSLEVDTRFKGTRYEPSVRGSISNIDDLNFTPQSLTKGFVNGMCEELLNYYNLIKKISGEKKFLVGSGNGVRLNKALRNIISKKFNMNLKIPSQTEEASYGVAMLVAAQEIGYCFIKNIKYEGNGECD